MSVQDAYDLYVEAGQPDYPDMDTPGLVTPEEIQEQLRTSARQKRGVRSASFK